MTDSTLPPPAYDDRAPDTFGGVLRALVPLAFPIARVLVGRAAVKAREELARVQNHVETLGAIYEKLDVLEAAVDEDLELEDDEDTAGDMPRELPFKLSIGVAEEPFAMFSDRADALEHASKLVDAAQLLVFTDTDVGEVLVRRPFAAEWISFDDWARIMPRGGQVST